MWNPYPGLILDEIPGTNSAKDQMQYIEDENIVLVEFRLVGARSQSQEELEVRELVELLNQIGLNITSAPPWSLSRGRRDGGADVPVVSIVPPSDPWWYYWRPRP